MQPSPPRIGPRIALPWILRLRYAIAAGQVATVAVVHWLLGIELPVAWMILPPALVALSNLWLSRREDGAREAWITAAFVLDFLCLTANLALSGGPYNPFTLLYLVQVTLAATLLTWRATWALGVLASLCFASLFWVHRPIPELVMHHQGANNLHLVGMWVGFAIASTLVAVFSGRISEVLREHEESLRRVQEELSRKDRLAALATLAAGAAHELSTPLATIAVVAKDLEHYAAQVTHDAAVVEDCQLVRKEVDRCRSILNRMRVEGADPSGEALADVPADALLTAIERAFAGIHPLRISLPPGGVPLLPRIPRHAVEQAVIALVKNAVEASPATPVDVAVLMTPGAIRIEVRDHGTGMTAEVLRHAGEPFFTTKDPGRGMGLGIFLVRTLARRLGGRFELHSTPVAGTVAALELPAAPVRAKAAV